MKLLFDSTIFCQQKFGGVSNYWIEFMSRFDESQNQMSILVFDKKFYKNTFPLCLKRYNFIKDININPKYVRFFSAPKIQDKDQYIFHSTYLRISNQKNVKTVVTIHDFTHQKYMNFWHKTINSFLKRRAIKHADGIVCISNNTLKDLKEFYPKLEDKKVTVIYNGANFEKFYKIEIDKLPERFNFLSDKKFILYVGARTGYKNFDFALKLIDNTNDYILCVIGGENLSTELKEQYKGKIIQYQNVYDNDLNLLYNKAFLFLYPSLYEGFGIPIAEAMNCGCPVMAFNNSSIPEVMNGAGILLENNDINSAIVHLKKLEDNNYRNELIIKEQLACKKFSWDIAYQQMLEFYNDVIKNSDD